MSRKQKTIKRRNLGFTLSNVLKVLTVILLLLVLVCMIKTCIHCTQQSQGNIVYQTGYNPDKEDWDNIPYVIPPYDDDDLDSLPAKVSLEQFFPPIGNQGNYGTCIAWAVGYNLKTALNAIEHKWTKEQLENAAYQTSPTDLWFSIPIEDKGTPCDATFFESAFTVLMHGVASMQKVPYKQLDNNCNGTKIGDPDNRIASFQAVATPTDKPKLEHIKALLKDTIPLAFGAYLGQLFYNAHDGTVLRGDININKEKGHAMVLSGYDDEKHAFRVRNSWGTVWGDQGSIWVDYDFFLSSDFCFAIFMAQNTPDDYFTKINH